jgi:hypothetical protein
LVQCPDEHVPYSVPISRPSAAYIEAGPQSAFVEQLTALHEFKHAPAKLVCVVTHVSPLGQSVSNVQIVVFVVEHVEIHVVEPDRVTEQVPPPEQSPSTEHPWDELFEQVFAQSAPIEHETRFA